MSSSSGSDVTNNQLASSSASSAQQSDDSTAQNDSSNKQSTSQVPQHRHVNNERDAGASTRYNLAVNDETQVSDNSLEEQHQLILDAQVNTPFATHVRSPMQLLADDGTWILCNLDFAQTTTPQLPTDPQDIPETQPIGDPSESNTCPNSNAVCDDLEEVSDYRFACIVCGKRFSHDELLLAHVGWAHPSDGVGGQRDEDNGLFPCDVCNVVGADSEARDRHAEEHTDQFTCLCAICKKRFALNEHLATHACTSGVDAESQPSDGVEGQRDEYNGQSTCTECGLVSADSEARDRHADEHNYQLTCPSCNKRFAPNEHLSTHACTSGVDAESQRTLINVERPLEDLLDQQMHLHEHVERRDAPPFVGSGNETTRRAPEAGQFDGDVALVCRWPSCGKTFASTWNLARHTKNHSGEKWFACRFCGKTFARKDTRDKHVRCVHNCGHTSRAFKKDDDEDENDKGQL